MGGGWALLYFTTYAMNHVGAAKVLESETLDFVLLLIVAAAMVAHTLRYDSRVVTGLAFLLAFSTINISHAPPSSLLASAILAVALVVIVGRRRWFDLEVLAIAAVTSITSFGCGPSLNRWKGTAIPSRSSFPALRC